MAPKRGGRRYPKEPASYSGVGKNSRRTDTQRVQVPNVGEAEDLAYGDRQKLEAQQRSAPLGRAPTPRVAPAATATRGQGGAALPEHLFAMPSARPTEPLTEGLPFGPGGGPEVLTQQEPTDEMEIVLNAMVQLTGDAAAAQMLDDHREFKAWKTERAATPVGTPQAPTPPSPESPPLEPEPNSDFDMPLEAEEPLDQPTSEEEPIEEAEGGETLEQPGVPETATGGDTEMV